MQKLSGKVALITGADSGIGQAMAIEMAKEGADIIVCYHTDREGAESTVNEVNHLKQKAIVVQVDLGNENEVERLFETALKEMKWIDILVNNAGVGGSGAKVADMVTADFDKTLRTNLYGTFFCCRSFIRHRREQNGQGKIINVTSIHEEVVQPGTADYCASKAAIRNLTRTLALELAAEGINVNNIAPGMILTPMNQESVDNKEVREEHAQHIPMKRAGLPEEIGKLAVFLASADSDYVTGSSYFMDGGLTLNLAQGA
jgi:glucose 1-dehydrogenase